jgi:hypothetical protein
MIKLTPDMINKCFENATHQQEVMIKLYKLAIPEWDNIKKLTGWPKISNDTWTYICKLFIEFDRKNHPDVMAGGCWMNSGFSIEKIPDWIIQPIEPDKIIYNNQRNKVTLITLDNMRKDGMMAIRFHRLLENNHSYYHPTRSSYKRLAKLLNSSLMQHTPRPTFKGLWTAV